MNKPDGLTLIDNAMLPQALADLPLRAIPGIGEGVENRLVRTGIRDFQGLWRLEAKQARALWGSVEGERFHYGLHGYEIRRAEPAAKKMIGHSRVLSGAYRQPDGARIVARALILKAASRLRYYGLFAGAMHLSAKLESGGALGHEAMFRPSQISWRFLRELDAFWPQMVAHMQRHGNGRGRLKLVSCYLHALSADPPIPDLFVAEDEDAYDVRQAGLWRRIDDLNRRYGRQKILLGSQRGLDLNYLGVKIAFSRVQPRSAAFSRVPEAAEFEC